jgi:hypothetical protein
MRVREREHWPTDVLMGDAIGVAAILAADAALGRISSWSDSRARIRDAA